MGVWGNQINYKIKMTSKITLSLLLISILLSSCTSSSKKFLCTETRITVGSGPEDMLIDRSTGEARLLISCADRRDREASFGEIVAYYPNSNKVDTLMRTGVPDSLYFHPHGIFLDSTVSPQLLYAISHEHNKKFHPIYVYEVGKDTLFFKEIISSELVYSPNALTLGPNGEILIVNDSGKRGSIMEKALKLNRANVVRLEQSSEGKWEAKIVASDLGYPAGINRIGNTLYVGDAIHHKFHIYTISGDELIEEEPLKGLKGNDNIRIIDGMIYVPGHIKPFKFISHAKSSLNLSPVEVWKVNPETREITSIYYTEGREISAGSTALMLDEKLYICQVFDPYILKVEF